MILELPWVCSTSLCDWSKKLVPLSQPITCKTNLKLVTRIFPRFRQVTCFYSEFSLVNDDDTQLETAPNVVCNFFEEERNSELQVMIKSYSHILNLV